MASTSLAYLKAETHLLPTLKSFPSTFHSFFTHHPILSLQSWFTYYSTVDPLHTAIVLCAIVSAAVYIAQKVTGNASQVDRIWTFAPVWNGAHFVLQPVIAAKLIKSGWAGEDFLANPVAKLTFMGRKAFTNSDVSATLQPRLALMLFLQVVWSTRLTYNAWRRGFFKPGEEDYRWPELRKGMPKWQWELFSFFFIAIAQNILLAITALPQYLLLTTTFSTGNQLSSTPNLQLRTADFVLAGIFLTNLFIEFWSDHQQQVYQNFKRDLFWGKARQPGQVALFDWRNDVDVFNNDDKKRGFITRGLWSWSRHPNFACEQMVWWYLYSFVPLTFLPSITGEWTIKTLHPLFMNYAIISPIAMSLLFVASTRYTEQMSIKKYPLYKEYQKAVGMFAPIDTLIRRVWYSVVAGREEANKVKEGVWGKVAGQE